MKRNHTFDPNDDTARSNHYTIRQRHTISILNAECILAGAIDFFFVLFSASTHARIARTKLGMTCRYSVYTTSTNFHFISLLFFVEQNYLEMPPTMHVSFVLFFFFSLSCGLLASLCDIHAMFKKRKWCEVGSEKKTATTWVLYIMYYDIY